MPPDWQLPQGVDRGLWDYLHSQDMVAGYDQQIAESALARIDVSFCEQWFSNRGRLIDLGCGTGRLAIHFAQRKFDCVGVDLSQAMLAQAAANAEKAKVRVAWRQGNLVELLNVPGESFDYAACLFSTLGMIRGADHQLIALGHMFRILRPLGRLVLHVHNRWYPALGWKRFRTSTFTMPQSYGGAPLTLQHFTRSRAVQLIQSAGFQVLNVTPVAATPSGKLNASWFFPGQRAYGFLIAAERPNE